VHALAINLSTSTLFCIAPAHIYAPSLVDVELTLNGQQYTLDRVAFSVHAPVGVHVLSPSSGPSDGETVLILLGGPFVNGSDYRCRFAPSGPTSDGVPAGAPVADYWREEFEGVHATVGGTPLNASAMRCVSPRQPRTLRANVEVTLNGQQYTRSGRVFEYTVASLIVSYMSPTTGPYHGGTQLVVHAHGVRLGTHYCCRMSVHDDSVGANNDANAIVLPATFDALGSFQQTPWGRVAGTLPVPTASPVDAIRCTTPDAADPNMINQTLTVTEITRRTVALGLPLSVSVATNCQQYTAPHSNAVFTYFGAPPKTGPYDDRFPEVYRTYIPAADPPVPAPLILAVSPTSGPARGQTNITLYGGPFLNGSDVRCRFAPFMVLTPASAATGGSTLRCQSPHISAAALTNASAGPASSPIASGLIEVTLNGVQYSSGNNVQFATYAHPHVSELSPASGPILGGTLLSVMGLGLTHGAHRLCRFIMPVRAYPNDDGVGATVAASVDGMQLLCRTPASASNVTQLSAVEVFVLFRNRTQSTSVVLTPICSISGDTQRSTAHKQWGSL
jgi:hypothetical protein